VNAPAAANHLGLPARRALLHAAAALWLPALVPIVTGMLRGCPHCQESYLVSLPIVPGILAPVLLNLDDAPFVVCGAAVTLGLLAVLALLLYELPRGLALAVQIVAAVAITFEAIGFAHALRA
jgi:hypothetical protein